MFTSGELERVSMALDAPMRQMEMRIMSDIVRRIKESGELTSTADWQINRLVQNGVSMEEVRTAVSDALGCSDAEVTEIFTAAVREGYVRDRRLYEQSGNVFVPFEENAELQQLLGAVTVQTNTTLRNITQSLGFVRRGADGHIHFIPLAGYYQQTLDSAVLDIASGAFDYDTVLKRAVREMTDSGLRTVDYATGWSNRVDVAARRAIMTGMNQLTAQMNEANAEKLGTDWFEVSWHSGARPSHWWGGRWFTRKQLETVCGLGDVTGLCGANCYHGYSPVIPGISVPTYSDEELAEMNRRENEPVEWNGRKYTRYEALQRQRRLETTMRAQRQEMQLLKEGGASEDDLINCRARYRTTSDEYARFSQAAGLPQQRERVTADELGNIMQGRYKGGSGKPSPVKVPPVGAEVNDRVTSAERTELLSRNPVDIHNSSIDNSGGSGIIELNRRMAATGQHPPDFSQFPISEDFGSVERIRNSIVNDLGVSSHKVKLDGIKNADVLEPFVKRLISIQKSTSMNIPAIVAIDVIDGDMCCVANFKPYEGILYISSRYFNSKDALLSAFSNWRNNNIMPKQLKNITFLAEHEAAHIRIPDELLKTDEAVSIWKKRKLLAENDKDIYEYFADATAIFRMNPNTQDENILAAIKYLKNGGAIV